MSELILCCQTIAIFYETLSFVRFLIRTLRNFYFLILSSNCQQAMLDDVRSNDYEAMEWNLQFAKK